MLVSWRPVCSVALAGLMLACAPAVTAEDKADHKHAEPEACAKACAACTLECETCFLECAKLVAGGKKEQLSCMRMCKDCADVCSLTAKVVSRRGPTASVMADVCAKTCEAC